MKVGGKGICGEGEEEGDSGYKGVKAVDEFEEGGEAGKEGFLGGTESFGELVGGK